MLLHRRASINLIMNNGFITTRERGAGPSFSPGMFLESSAGTLKRFDTRDEGADDSLDEAARNEREYVRRRLREELKREPTEQELDEWLRQHTEGY